MTRAKGLTDWLRSRLNVKNDIPATTCVIFTVPEKRLSEMDVATGPCVPIPGRKRALRSVHSQEGPETPEQMRAFFTVLGGSAHESKSALELVTSSGLGSLYQCSDHFVQLMRNENEEAIRLSDLDKANGDKNLTLFVAHECAVDDAWMAAGSWHRAQVGTSNKLYRSAWARIAQQKGQSMYCWYGPPVPEYVIVSGTGPYPEKIR